MKLLFAFLTTITLFFQGNDLDDIRTKYSTAAVSKANADAFNKMITNSSGSTSTYDGYKAAAKIIQAKFAVGEGRKKLITDGAKNLENIIKANPNNIELRVIRMSIQEGLPKFIKYNQNITTDKSFIIKNYSSQNSGLKSFIKKYASTSKSFTPAERASLK